MIKQAGLDGLGKRRHDGVFWTILSLSLSKASCLVFNFRGCVLRTLGSLCPLFSESTSRGVRALPRLTAQAVAPGIAAVERFHLRLAVRCVGKDFKKQLTT